MTSTRRTATARLRCTGSRVSATPISSRGCSRRAPKSTAPNRHGVTPLQVAIGEGNAGVVRRLLEAGADANKLDAAGESPLLLAARVGEPEVARALLAHGAAVDGREQSFGQTPLMVAVREGHSELARVLLDAGADPNARTRAEPPPRFIPPSESPPGLSKGIGIVRAGWPEDRGKRFPAAGSKTPLAVRGARRRPRRRPSYSSSAARSSSSPTATA